VGDGAGDGDAGVEGDDDEELLPHAIAPIMTAEITARRNDTMRSSEYEIS
jgi:hypothetical protein